MARDPFLENPDKFLDHIDAPTAWNTSLYSCFFCYRRDLPTIITTGGRMCSACVLDTLRAQRKVQDLPPSCRRDPGEILSPEASLSRKLLFLQNFTKFYPRGITGDPESRQRISRSLVASLGYATGHPLAAALRETALSACRHLGRGLLPYLLEIGSPSPWELHAGIILAAGSIAPEDPDVRSLLEKAAGDPHPGVRRAVPQFLARNDAPWAKTLMSGLAEDPDPGVKETCRDFIPKGRRQSGKKALERKPARKEAGTRPPPPVDAVQELIQNLYSLEDLKAVIPIYFKKFMSTKEMKNHGRISMDKMPKRQLAGIVAKAFRTSKSMSKFLNPIPRELRSILVTLAFRPGSVSVESIEKQTGMTVIDRSLRPGKQSIIPAFRLFQIHEAYVGYTKSGISYRYFLYLDEGLRKLFMKFLDPPQDYHIGPATAVQETTFRFEDHGRLFARADMISEYVRQGHLKLSKSGRKILISAIKKMASVCNLDEFYGSDDMALCYMRTQLLGDFFLGNPPPNTLTDPAAFKRFVTAAFSENASNSYPLYTLLHHLNRIGYADIADYAASGDERDVRVSAALLAMLREMPVGEWVCISSCVAYAVYRIKDFEIISPVAAREYVTFTGDVVAENDDAGASNSERRRIHPWRYIDAVTTPFIKAALFLWGSLGLLDLAYDPPANDRFRLSGKPFLSRYDGLRYVRLNELGAYVIGLSETYNPTVAAAVQARVILDENHLIINLDAHDPIKAMTLEMLAERISDTCFRMSFGSFLKGCAHETDVEERIELFESLIEGRIPEIWEDFLKEIERRTSLLKARDDAFVFQLRPDPDLLDLMAGDPVLKKYILKAERHHVIILNRDISHVKRRLADLGYFWDGD